MVWGYFTILWTMPELEENYLDDVYGVINDFTATITHKPYEGVELDSLIDEVNTHIVARDSVKQAYAVSPDFDGRIPLAYKKDGGKVTVTLPKTALKTYTLVYVE